MPANFPRLLVATEFSPNASGGGPAVVRQMLRDWPVEKLFWWSCLPETDQRFGQKVTSQAVARIPAKLYPHQRWCAQKAWLLEQFWAPRAARDFQRVLAAWQPEVVWVIPHAWVIPVLARALPRARIGFHVSVHDYPDTHSDRIRLGLARSFRMAAMCDRLYASATTRDAICQPMVEDLRQRTGCDGRVTRAGLEPEDFDGLAAAAPPASESIRIAYAGTIIAEREFALFARALGQIRQRLPAPLWLDFFGAHSYRSREWFEADWMREHGLLSAPELAVELRKCTWGFSPMAP